MNSCSKWLFSLYIFNINCKELDPEKKACAALIRTCEENSCELRAELKVSRKLEGYSIN